MNIYVGNLAYETNEDNLRDAFSAYGQVESVSVIKDKITGRSKGFGFVTMPNQEEAQKAIAGLNERPLQGRNVRINEARPKTEGGGGRGGYGGDRY
jgi:RNA recognition motif-containing protein